MLVLHGVAGVGKTALLHRAVRDADGFRVLRAEGVEAESELAFAGLHQLLRPVLDLVERIPPVRRAALEVALGLAPGEVGARFLVATWALDLLAEAAEEGPVLGVVDDVQWLDRPSVDAIAFTARRLLAEPIALLLASRDEEPSLRRFPALRLDGLAPDEARELLARSARLAPVDRERVLAAAEGIPWRSWS